MAVEREYEVSPANFSHKEKTGITYEIDSILTDIANKMIFFDDETKNRVGLITEIISEEKKQAVKEEDRTKLQKLKEELITLNEELKKKEEEVRRANIEVLDGGQKFPKSNKNKIGTETIPLIPTTPPARYKRPASHLEVKPGGEKTNIQGNEETAAEKVNYDN